MNYLVAMSGGTTTVINATLVGIINSAKENNLKVFAGIPGISGILNGNIIELTEKYTDDDLKLIRNLPASGIVGTSRIKKMNNAEFNKFKEIVAEFEISTFFNIGGNGTIKQSKYISQHMPMLNVISLPKTVDNDLGDGDLKDMHYTPGFPSVVNYWMKKVEMLNNENLGAYSHDKVLVAQTFGRDVGFIAGSVRLADPERKIPLIILLPEDQQDLASVLDKINDTVEKHGRALVVMSEGYIIDDVKPRFDYSGQIMYSSSGDLVAQSLVNKLCDIGIQSRAFIPGVDQRSCNEYTLKCDRDIAYDCGVYATALASENKTDIIVTVSETGHLKTVEYDSFKNYSRKMSPEFIDKGNFDVTDMYVKYLNGIGDYDEVHLF